MDSGFQTHLFNRCGSWIASANGEADRQCGPGIRAFALRFGNPEFKTRSDHSLSPRFNFSPALVNSQLVCLQQVGILKSCGSVLLCLFRLAMKLALFEAVN